MMTFSKQMRVFPVLSRDSIGKGMKRFIFWTVFILHCFVFVLPFCWYLLMTWLNPPQKAISVTLVENPTQEPFSKRGTPANAGKKTESDSRKEVAAPPEVGEIPDLPGSIPDVPDVPDVPRIKRPPRPKETPVVTKKPPVKTVTAQVPSPPVKKTSPTQKTATPPKKQSMEERIREWRKQHGGKRVRVTKNTNPAGGTGSSARSRELAGIADDISDMIGNGGTADSGAGGVYDRYNAILTNYIQTRWRPYKPDSIALRGTKPVVQLSFLIDGSGRILRKSIAKRCGIPAVDTAVESFLRSLTVLPPPPDRKRQTLTLNLEVEPARGF